MFVKEIRWKNKTMMKANDEDNDEGNDGDNDDAIGGTKKRKVDKWDDWCQQWIQLMTRWNNVAQSASETYDTQQYCTTESNSEDLLQQEWKLEQCTRTFLYRRQFRSQTMSWSFTTWFDNDVLFNNYLFRFPECLNNSVPNNLRDGVKIHVYIQYVAICVTWCTQLCTMPITAGALGSSLTDNSPEYKRCWVTCNHIVYKLSWFLHIYLSIYLAS